MLTSESAPCPSTTGASSRKEKKKQAKEERDRLKQVEKKKRRLEKALATATAIRIELEKKKQRRKEEERRLDEEGAALAEAVALQVLVEEEALSLEESICEEAYQSGSSKAVSYPVLSKSDAKPQLCSTSAGSVTNNEVHIEEVAMNSISRCSNRREQSEDVQVKRLQVLSGWQISRDNLTFSSKRAKAAELAAGLAAAQAVAALKIAEEARAEAEAAKKAAEEAICHVLDRRNSECDQQVTFYPLNIEIERDELKARLEETERQLMEKTRQVFHLEQSLEEMSQYLLHLKSKLPSPNSRFEREAETSERGSTNLAEPSHGTTDQ